MCQFLSGCAGKKNRSPPNDGGADFLFLSFFFFGLGGKGKISPGGEEDISGFFFLLKSPRPYQVVALSPRTSSSRLHPFQYSKLCVNPDLLPTARGGGFKALAGGGSNGEHKGERDGTIMI